MTIEYQHEHKSGTRLRLSLTTLNVDTHSRIQELDPSQRMMLENGLRSACEWATIFISENTTKKTA